MLGCIKYQPNNNKKKKNKNNANNGCSSNINNKMIMMISVFTNMPFVWFILLLAFNFQCDLVLFHSISDWRLVDISFI